MTLPSIARADNDLLFDTDGRRYIDLFSAHGVAWLGHANRAIGARIAAQLERVWITGALPTPILDEATAMLGEWFPPSHGVRGFYSTGMEAAEFVLRMARVTTGRTGAVGFEHSMHGKSLATACLGWDNGDGVRLPGFVRLPFVAGTSEEGVTAALEETLATGSVSAVFVEPLQGSSGGGSASDAFYRRAAELTRRHGALLVFDEILTGFYRTGSPFVFSRLGIVPDVILVGKALGNGFPVAAVVTARRYPVLPAMLPGSTYAANALAASAVSATLGTMRMLDLPARVATIERTIADSFGALTEPGIEVRGRGALWVVTLPTPADAERAAARIYGRGVAVGVTRRHLRILPAATIEPQHLQEGCAVVVEEALRRE